MKKIVVYVGSRKQKSNTKRYINAILEKVNEKNDVEFEIITPNSTNINHCKGCETCFTNGFCAFDKQDDMGKVREKLLNADMVIFSSPVYAHNVSGDTKILFDRLSHWFHNMKLAGKYSMVISTTATNGHTTVVDYMEKLMYYMGTKLIAKMNVSHGYPNQLNNKEWFEQHTNVMAEKIVQALNKPIETDNNLEMVFTTMKSRYNMMKENRQVIGNMRDSIELCECESFKDYLEKSKDLSLL